MIIILHGKDAFRIDEKVKNIISGYKKKNKSGMNIVFLTEKPSFNDLKNESRQMGMFKEKKLLIGTDILKNENLKKEVKKRAEELAKGDNILILKEHQELKAKFLKKIEKISDKEALIQKFDKLKGRKLKSWYKKRIGENQADYQTGVIDKLIEYVGDDLWRASTEISKLAAMREGEEIKVKDIIRYVKPDIKNDIFKTIDSLANGEREKAVNLIEKHLQEGDSPFYLLSMINYQVRNLLTVKELESKNLPYNEMKKKSKMSPFVFNKSRKQSKKISFSKMRKIHQKLFMVDLDIKSGKITPEIGITLVTSCF